MAEAEICLVDSGTTNTILRETRYFQTLAKKNGNIMTIAGSNAHIVGTGSATLVLPMGSQIFVKDALLYPDSKRTLLSFKDIRANGFHQKRVVERLPSSPSGLYYTYIKPTEEYVAMKTIFRNTESFRIWHDRLGHPGLSMMRRIINNSAGHDVRSFPTPEDFICTACAKGKLITRPSLLKIRDESPVFLQRIQGDICGPIQPLSGPFRYFVVLIDASTRWSYVDLLSTRNHAFSKLIAQIIRLKASFPDNRIQSIRMDNAGEFRSKAFDDYCLAMSIKVEHSVPHVHTRHVHTQNGLAESLIKRIKWIARPLLQNCRLPTSCWGHAVLHAAALTQLRPTAYHESPPTAGAWERTKYFPSAYIWQRCIRANTTASAYINGSPPKVGDLCWL
jgi:peptide/histidine transporter 3/4